MPRPTPSVIESGVKAIRTKKVEEGESSMPTSPATINVVFFGATGAFSRPSLAALLRAGYRVRAVVVAALPGVPSDASPFTVLPPRTAPRTPTRRTLPLVASPAPGTILQLAAERGIPILEVARLRDSRTLDALAAFQPDVMSVACFSRRLPAELLRLPRLGCLNVHPSLLPANRGPDPFFWTFARGDAETGATVHLMDEGFDTGPILRQQRISVPDGCSEYELERACATTGGELLAPSIAGLASGAIHPTPQDERLATAYSWPRLEDYVITPNRPAHWAYNFAAGLRDRSESIRVHVPGAAFRVLAPLGYDPHAMLDAPWRSNGDELSLQCSPGVFTCRAAPLTAASQAS